MREGGNEKSRVSGCALREFGGKLVDFGSSMSDCPPKVQSMWAIAAFAIEAIAHIKPR
jgi:hypothetical protein